MRVDRRAFLLTTLAAACACRRSEPDGDLERAVRYLWDQQGPDGGFHSATYGLLASGQSLTPFVLGVLLDVPESVMAPSARAVEDALAFIRRHTTSDGVLGVTGEESADYPNYATALAVQALVKAGARGFEPMVGQLRRQQFSEANGWGATEAPYGGWGMGGPIRRPPAPGHVDLSMTRSVLEALRAAGVPASDPVFERALVYLARSQNRDGGFFFSPVNTQTNKGGGIASGGFRSYGTATADGLLALRAAGIPESDDRVRRAVGWLEAHHEPDRVPGLDAGPYAGWDTGLRFYYAGVVSRAMPHLPVLLPPPEADGSFRNPNNLVKEDDPLIATTFAVEALRLRPAPPRPGPRR
jgi:hypothetical protein